METANNVGILIHYPLFSIFAVAFNAMKCHEMIRIYFKYYINSLFTTKSNEFYT